MTIIPATRRMRDFLAALTALGVLFGSPLLAQVKPIPTESSVVGELRNYQDSQVGVVDALVLLGAVQGKPAGYPDLKTAKTAAVELPGVEAIVKVSASTYQLHAIRLIPNTPENTARIARGEFAALTESDLGVVQYRNLKCRFRHLEMNLDRVLNTQPGLINVVDPQGLYVASYKITPIVSSAAKILLMTLDREIANGNFHEAKEIYLYLEDLNAKNQDQPIVQATAQNYLRKFYHSGDPGLRAFAEVEMDRRGYAETLKTVIKSGR